MPVTLKINVRHVRNILNPHCHRCHVYRMSHSMNRQTTKGLPEFELLYLWPTQELIILVPHTCQTCHKVMHHWCPVSPSAGVLSHPLNPVAWPVTSNTWKKPRSLRPLTPAVFITVWHLLNTSESSAIHIRYFQHAVNSLWSKDIWFTYQMSQLSSNLSYSIYPK